MSAAPLITVFKDGQAVKTQEVDGEIVLGRAEGCVIRLDDRAVSREHAVFKATGKGVEVQKKSEFAQLKVNGLDCTHAIIKEGDVIDIGPYQVRMSKGEAKDPFKSPAQIIEFQTKQESPSIQAIQINEVMPSIESPDRTKVLSMDELQAIDQVPLDASKTESQIEVNATGASEFTFNPVETASENPVQFDFNQSQDSDQKTQLGISSAGPASEDDGRTRVTVAGAVDIKLVFEPGSANIDEIAVGNEPISVGRGKECTVVLTDKKASRKHAVIERRGMQVLIKDLNSANGTYVDGKKITEQQLSGNSRIQIGTAVFKLVAEDSNFEADAQGFLQPKPGKDDVPELTLDAVAASMASATPMEVETPNYGGQSQQPQFESANPYGQNNQQQQMMPPGQQPMQSVPMMDNPFNPQFQPQMGTQGGMSQIAGLGGGKQGLYEKYIKNFTNLKPVQKILVVFVVGGLGYFLLEEEPVKKVKAPTAIASAQPSSAVVSNAPKTADDTKVSAEEWQVAFDKLTEDKKRFIVTQHELAFNFYKNRDYDKSLYEIRKIFSIIPDYKNAKEIERYAEEGKRKLEALQEEQKKKEDETKLKAKVAALVVEAKAKVEAKDYESAKQIFVEILSLDPENKIVAELKLAIREDEESKQEELQRSQIRLEVNKRAWEEFNQGMKLFKAEKYQKAIDVFIGVQDIEATDKKVFARSKEQIKSAKRAIAEKRDPLIEDGKKLEEEGELSKAYKSYQKAYRADPDHQAPIAGMDRIRGVLHARAKVLYTEAVLAESYSDFELAKRKYEECLNTVPDDDIYYERAKRKLSTYTLHKDEIGLGQ